MNQNIITLNPASLENQTSSLRAFMLRSLVVLLALSFMGMTLFGQNPLSGQIVDTETGQPLPYASVSILDSGSVQETATDEFGYFSFENVSGGDHTLKVDAMDYESVILTGVQTGDQALSAPVQLKEKGESHANATMEDLVF